MIHKETLSAIASGINSMPCPVCGRNHCVNLSLNSAHIFAKSSADWLVSRSGERVFVEIEEGACGEFRNRVARFLSGYVFGE